MKRIILLEDNSFEAEDLKDEIEHQFSQLSELDIELAESIYRLDDILLSNNGIKEGYEHCCLVVDLNLPPDYMKERIPPAERKFTGWYWLEKKEKLLFQSGITVIFHSAFIEKFKDAHFDAYNQYKENKFVQMIPKSIENANLIAALKDYLES